jgi:hypothetical protein
MSIERDLLKEVLEYFDPLGLNTEHCGDLPERIKELLAQPETEQEPVAWMHEGVDETGETVRSIYHHFYEHANLIPLYTTPPKREPLSDYATYDMFRASKQAVTASCYWAGIRDAEKAHGIGVDDE